MNLFNFFKSKPVKVQPPKVINSDTIRELKITSLENVMYLEAAINTMNSVVSCMKGGNAMETRRKRIEAKEQLNWLTKKLIEEKVWYDHYKLIETN